MVSEYGGQVFKTRRNFHIAMPMRICGMTPDCLCDQVTLVSDKTTENTRHTHSLDTKSEQEFFVNLLNIEELCL